MSGDPQHPFDGEAPRHADWVLPESEPTNLIALWPDDQAPTRMEILSALATTLGESLEVLDEMGERSGDFEWASIVKVPGYERPIAIWTEPSRPMSEEELDAAGGRRCPWVVGVEAVLEESDPLRDYTGLVRLLMRSLPDSPAMLDVTTSRWTSREAIDAMFEQPEVEPPGDVLWVVEARRRSDDPVAAAWLRTRGLARCGRPELEMLDVTGELTESAATVLNGMAAMLFEAEPPAPGVPWTIGHGLNVSLVPWAALASEVDDSVTGGPPDRTDDPTPSGVVCDVAEDGGPDLRRLWPNQVVRSVAGDEACGLYWTERATRRQADLARAGWDQFATAWASIRMAGVLDSDEPPAVFGLKAGCPVPDRPDLNHEHLWFRLLGLDNGSIDCELVNDPVHEVGMHRGDRVSIGRERVADWLVVTRYGSFGPSDVDTMWTAIDRLRTDHEAGGSGAQEAGAEMAGDEPDDGDALHESS